VDIQEIITEFGAYYIANAQNMGRLVQRINRAAITETLLTPMVTDDTLYRGAESQFSRVVQPFQSKWTPLANLKVVPIEIQLFKQKVDLDEEPHVLEATWLGFLTGDDIDPAQWPFIRWYMEVHLLPQIPLDMEMNELYAGKYLAPVSGTPGAAGTAMDGLKTLINRQVAASRITPISIGAIPTTSNLDTYEYFELFADRIAKAYWKIPMVIGCDEAVARRAIRGKRQKYGKDIEGVGNVNAIEDTNLTFLGLPSMDGANKIWCTPKYNVCYFRKKSQNMKNFKVESVKRILSLFTDFWNGVGFHIPEIVFTNDQDLV
jgi:hypothetical protein